MNRKMSCIIVGTMIWALVGCSSQDTAATTAEPEVVSEEVSQGEVEIDEGEVTIVGQVVSVTGNMVTIQIGSYIEQEGMVQGGRTEGEMPEGEMTEREMPEGMTEGEMTEREMPEGMTEGEMLEGEMTEREMPEGMTEGEMPEGMMAGGMGSMQGGMMEGGIEAVDMSEFIELTDETVKITIPVGTPVYSMGVEYDFTDIVEECYITISENESGTIVAVNILG